MRFVLKGQAYTADKELTEFKMFGVKPKAITKYYIIVNRRRYPIKQVIHVLTELGYSQFGSTDAGHLMRRLGFKLRWL